MIEKTINNFNLSDICKSGQVFRMYERETGLFDVYSAERHLRLKQEGKKVTFFCRKEDFDGYWKHYFDLDRDYSVLGKDLVTENGKETACNSGQAGKNGSDMGRNFLKRAYNTGCDIRILHQDIWEMMITFIISQQKQIPSIRKCVEALCERFGEKRNDEYGEWYTFPTPASIAAGGPEGLKGLSLGYRERYIYETSVRYLEKGLPDENVEAMDYENARKYLLSFTGIGEKVANCILLFGAGFVDAFPIDTHIMDILYREFYMKQPAGWDKRLPSAVNCRGKNTSDGQRREKTSGKLPQDKLTRSDYETLIDLHFSKYKGYRGIVQQWIFAYELWGD